MRFGWAERPPPPPRRLNPLNIRWLSQWRCPGLPPPHLHLTFYRPRLGESVTRRFSLCHPYPSFYQPRPVVSSSISVVSHFRQYHDQIGKQQKYGESIKLLIVKYLDLFSTVEVIVPPPPCAYIRISALKALKVEVEVNSTIQVETRHSACTFRSPLHAGIIRPIARHPRAVTLSSSSTEEPKSIYLSSSLGRTPRPFPPRLLGIMSSTAS